jgi:hypothetical protein
MMSERLIQLSELFKPTHDTGDLTYSDIRKELLKLPHISPNRFFLPKVPIDVAFGDVGYMKDDLFLKLDNMREAFTDHEGEAIKGSEDYLTASGPIKSEDLDDGVIRLVHSVVHIHYNVMFVLLGIPSRMRSTSSFLAGNMSSACVRCTSIGRSSSRKLENSYVPAKTSTIFL